MMAHKRLRKFNTRDTYPEQKLDNDLCQAVVAGNIVFLRGQIAQDLDTRHRNISAMPAADRQGHGEYRHADGGGRRSSTISEDRRLPDRHPLSRGRLSGDGQMAQGRLSLFDRPGRARLARPEWMVEIDVTAVIPDGYKPKRKRKNDLFHRGALPRHRHVRRGGVLLLAASPPAAPRRAPASARSARRTSPTPLGPRALT